MEQRKPVVRCLIAAIIVPCLAACVSSPETKLASTQYKAAIEAYARNIQAFEDAWVAEFDRAIKDLSDALVATAVTKKIQELSAPSGGFSSDDWEKEFSSNGLIALSRAIDNERARVDKYLVFLYKFDVTANDDINTLRQDAIDAFNAKAIKALEKLPDGAEKEALQADLALGPFGDDVKANALVEKILIWRKAQASVPQDLENLSIVVSALRQAHDSVNEWIQTDVTVPGDDLAGLVNAWSTSVGGAQ